MLQKSTVLGKYIQMHRSTTAAALFSSSRDVRTPKSSAGLLSRYAGPDAGVEKEGSKVNRWTMLVPAMLTHACLGAPYGWSAVSSALTREQGMDRYSSNDSKVWTGIVAMMARYKQV